jgi:hypothetical protein
MLPGAAPFELRKRWLIRRLWTKAEKNPEVKHCDLNCSHFTVRRHHFAKKALRRSRRRAFFREKSGQQEGYRTQLKLGGE